MSAELIERAREGFYVGKDEWLPAMEALARRLERAEAVLGIIATSTYPATYLGRREDGAEMYGGSDDASRFAAAYFEEEAGA